LASPWDIQTNLNLPNGGEASNDVSNIPGEVSGALQGIGNFITGKTWAPQYNPATIDPGSASQVASIENGLLATPQQNTDKIMQGTGAAGQIENQSEQAQNENSEHGGGGISGMSQAISNKASKNFSTSQNKLNANAQFQGQAMANNNINVATANSIAMQNAQYNLQSSINNANLQANQARYNTIGGLMSGAGSFAGSYYGHQQTPAPMTSEQYASQGSEGMDAGSTPNVYNQNGQGTYDPMNGPTVQSGYEGE